MQKGLSGSDPDHSPSCLFGDASARLLRFRSLGFIDFQMCASPHPIVEMFRDTPIVEIFAALKLDKPL